jgi:hypothetical protein
MFCANVHALDDHTTVIQQNVDHLTALTFIFEAATDHLDGIAFANLDSHTYYSP